MLFSSLGSCVPLIDTLYLCKIILCDCKIYCINIVTGVNVIYIIGENILVKNVRRL